MSKFLGIKVRAHSAKDYRTEDPYCCHINDFISTLNKLWKYLSGQQEGMLPQPQLELLKWYFLMRFYSNYLNLIIARQGKSIQRRSINCSAQFYIPTNLSK
jgi:hypothetical protein